MPRRQTRAPSGSGPPAQDTRAQARAAALAGDRGQAMTILQAIATSPGDRAADVAPALAEALVVTARDVERREEADRRALERYERAQAAHGEILRLIRSAPLDRDDLASIAAALRDREREVKAEERQLAEEDRAARQAAAIAGRRLGAGYL